MAIVRTLITTLGYKVDEAGLNQYEAGFQRIKSMTLGFASAMGLAFGAEKIYEFIDGLLDTGKEINKIRSQLNNLARPQDEVNAAMDRTLEIANALGVEYAKVADTFREFLQNSREGKLSQEDLLRATENVYKALRVDKASEEQSQRMFALIERIDVMGKASPRMIGMLQNASQSALVLLEEYFKTDEDGLRALAKEGKITAEVFMQALARPSEALNERFSKAPYTIGRAFAYARNQITPLIAELLKTTRVSVILGTTIKWLVDIIVNGIKWFNREVIQIKQLVEVLGYALAVALGPWLIRQLTLATIWTGRWAAATLAANWPWILLAASIVAVGFAIQDLVYWIQGKGSFIGSWVGPFDQLTENFKKLDIFAGPRFIADLVKGDWSAALKDFNILLEDTSAKVLAIGGAVIAVGFLFGTWLTILRPLGRALTAAKDVVAGGKPAADAVGGKGAKPTPATEPVPSGQGALPLAGGGPRVTTKFGGPASGLGFGLAFEYTQQYIDKHFPSINKAQDKTAESIDKWLSDTFQSFKYMKPGMGKLGEWLWPSAAPGAEVTDPTKIGPGALAKPSTTDNRNQSVTVNHSPTNNITVTTEDQSMVASIIQQKLTDIGKATSDAIAKQIVTSMPRTEAATQ